MATPTPITPSLAQTLGALAGHALTISELCRAVGIDEQAHPHRAREYLIQCRAWTEAGWLSLSSDLRYSARNCMHLALSPEDHALLTRITVALEQLGACVRIPARSQS